MRFPSMRLDIDALYTAGLPFDTSGGLSANIDPTPALIEADLGSEGLESNRSLLAPITG
jgi:transcriptional regulator GlxA family with amidase domain